jgi:hypothetical protein
MAERKRDKQPPKTKKYFRSTKKGAGMTKAGVARYRRENPGSKLRTAVTKKKNLTAKDKARRKSFCARSAGQMKKFPKAAKDPNSRLRQARRRWRCRRHRNACDVSNKLYILVPSKRSPCRPSPT